MDQLQKALFANALFSGTTGLLLLAAGPYAAQLFTLNDPLLFRILGAGLLLFSGFLIYETGRKEPVEVLAVILLDFLWVLGSLLLLVLQPFGISGAGHLIIAAIALIVLFMGIGQARALAKTDNRPGRGTKRLRFERTIRASTKEVWEAISDVGHYHEVAPNIDEVTILAGKGEGMVRSCSHGKDSWTETCSMWIDEKVYSFEVDTSAPDYPYPFKSLNGSWEVEKLDEAATKIIMAFEFQYKRSFQNWLLHPLLRRKFLKIAEELLDNWQDKLEGRTSGIITGAGHRR